MQNKEESIENSKADTTTHDHYAYHKEINQNKFYSNTKEATKAKIETTKRIFET